MTPSGRSCDCRGGRATAASVAFARRAPSERGNGRVRAPRQGRPDRPKFKTSGNVRLDTPAAEFGEAARAFAANFGTWSIDEANKTLIRRYEAALIPNVEGAETKVSVSLMGDDLKLTGADGAGQRTETVYRRAK